MPQILLVISGAIIAIITSADSGTPDIIEPCICKTGFSAELTAFDHNSSAVTVISTATVYAILLFRIAVLSRPLTLCLMCKGNDSVMSAVRQVLSYMRYSEIRSRRVIAI